MTNVAVIQSSVIPIMLAISNQLASTIPNLLGTKNVLTNKVLPIGLNMVLWTGKDHVPKFTGDHDIVMRVGSLISVTQGYEASGICQRISRYLTVYPRTRSLTDQADRDTNWLFNAASGHLAWEEMVLGSIWGYWPTDNWNTTPILGVDGVHPMTPTVYKGSDSTTGNLMTYTELQFSQGTDPVKGAIDKLWGESALTFDLNYLFQLGNASIP